MTDTFIKALDGDREAQLATMVETLAVHMRCLVMLLPKEHAELRRTTDALCDAALDYLKETR